MEYIVNKNFALSSDSHVKRGEIIDASKLDLVKNKVALINSGYVSLYGGNNSEIAQKQPLTVNKTETNARKKRGRPRKNS